MKNYALLAAAFLFGLMALIHLIRLLNPFPVILGSFVIPVWVSIFAFVILGLLSAWMFSAMMKN